MSRRLVADGQVFQTPAWHRGMGKYSLELLAALTACDDHDVEIVLSSQLPEDPSVATLLRERVPGARVSRLDLHRDRPGDPRVAEHNRRVLDEHLGGDPDPIDFLILSAMQGAIRPVFPTLGSATRLVLVFDLIPLMFHDTYLRFAEARTEYRSRLGELLSADRFLTISRTVANDVALYLGVDAARIASIDGAPIAHSPLPAHVDSVPEPFVLMPTGNDPRKNNRRAIQGFGRFNAARGGAYSLVITSSFRPDEVDALSALAPNVVFTGNLSGAQLADLYRRAAAVLFPPEYEGLGLPVLEAVEAGRPVACSDIAVFREISQTAFHMFDPESILDIANGLSRAVDQGPIDTAAYHEILHRYAWPKVAAAFRAAVEVPVPPRPALPLPQIAVVAPDAAFDDGPGRLVQDAHAELSRELAPVYALEPTPGEAPRRVSFLPDVAPAVALGPGVALPPADLTVVHLADSPACSGAYFHALAGVDVLVLHDTSLAEAWSALVKHGVLSASRIALEERVEALCAVPSTSHLAVPLSRTRAVVVFDESARDRVAAVAGAAGVAVRVEVLPVPVPTVRYPEVLPAKSLPATSLPLPPQRRLNADFRLAETLSRSRFITFTSPPRAQQVLEAMRFGTIPVLPGPAGQVGLPSDLTLSANGAADPETAMVPLLEDQGAYAALSRRAREHVDRTHCERHFAVAFAALVRDLIGE